MQRHAILPKRLLQVVRPALAATAERTRRRDTGRNSGRTHNPTPAPAGESTARHDTPPVTTHRPSPARALPAANARAHRRHAPTRRTSTRPQRTRGRPPPTPNVRQRHAGVHAEPRGHGALARGLPPPPAGTFGGHAQPRLRERVVADVRNELLGGEPNEPDDPLVRRDKAGAGEVVGYQRIGDRRLVVSARWGHATRAGHTPTRPRVWGGAGIQDATNKTGQGVRRKKETEG